MATTSTKCRAVDVVVVVEFSKQPMASSPKKNEWAIWHTLGKPALIETF